jgi:apolipoprotein N-acyltransferase
MSIRHWSLQGLLLLFCGAASGLAFAPLAWWPVWLVTVAWLLHTLAQAPWHRQLWMGWVFGLGAAVATTHWIGIALWHQSSMPKGVSLGASAIAWLYSAWPWGLLGMLGAVWDRLGWTGHNSTWKLPILTTALVLAWWSQSWWLGGFPWLVPGAIWLDTPLQGWGPVGGGLLMAALGLWLAAALSAVWRSRETHRSGHKAKAWYVRGAMALLWMGTFGAGAVLQDTTWTHALDRTVRVGVVQVDMPSTTQVGLAQEHAYQRMAWRITDALIVRHDVDVIVWPEGLLISPEGSLREWLAQHEELLQERSLAIGAIVQAEAFAASAQEQVPSSEMPQPRAHNSVLAHGPDSRGRYDKRELVPMTERWPVDGPWPLLAPWANSQPWLQAGARHQAPLTLAGQHVGTSICYEDAFGHIYQGLPASVSWLINISNDGWFARTPVMPAQHLALSRLRAKKKKKPLVRAANIGPSAVVNAWGQTIARTPIGQTQMLHAHVHPRQGHTPYARWGHAWLGVTGSCLLLLFGASVWRGSRARLHAAQPPL